MSSSDPVLSASVVRVSSLGAVSGPDQLVVEEPLEIQIAFGAKEKRQRLAMAVTMRTPGQDRELALGFLYTEGIIGRLADVLDVRWADNHENRLLVELHPAFRFDPARVSRHFYTSSSCGVCGKASLDLVSATVCHLLKPGQPRVAPEGLYPLTEALRQQQRVFECTGGLHAAGLFDADGRLDLLREDVGRHNALDKIIGAALLQQRIPLKNQLLVLSGRIGFELVQKALMAGIPFLAAVGAPSSLAVQLAEEHGMTLVGFLRPHSFNIYCGAERVQ
jgi:FdhD protein